LCQRGIRINSLKKKKYPCIVNPNVLPLDHDVHLVELRKISAQVKSQIVLEESLKFFLKKQGAQGIANPPPTTRTYKKERQLKINER
jgi:hypothetical protein